jgi:non-homologous end joining protein Ku
VRAFTAPDEGFLPVPILDSRAGDFDPGTFRDRYEEALLAHLRPNRRAARLSNVSGFHLFTVGPLPNLFAD